MNNAKTIQSTGSHKSGKNGYTGDGQTQYGADQDISGLTIAKGGMRGAGLVAAMIAEIALKEKAVDLAEDYYDVNKKDYNFFIAQHQGPIAQTASEAFSPTLNPKYTVDFLAMIPGGVAKTSILDKQWFESRRRAHRYAVGAQRRIDYQFAINRTFAVVAGWNLGKRYEINWVDDRNNRRDNRRIAIANVGLGIGNIVRQGLASSMSGLASAYDTLGDTVATIGNGLAFSGGYRAGRNATSQRYGNVKTASNMKQANKD